METKIDDVIQSTNNWTELEVVKTKNFQEDRAESVSTTIDVRRGVQKLSTRRPPQPTTQEILNHMDDARRVRTESGLDLGALL